jgi:hypothetical protein
MTLDGFVGGPYGDLNGTPLNKYRNYGEEQKIKMNIRKLKIRNHYEQSQSKGIFSFTGWLWSWT